MTQIIAQEKLSIAVLGAGSIGCYLGGQLCRSGQELIFIGRENFKAAIDDKGLRLSHFKRDDIIIPANDIDISLEAESMAKADVILLTVKSQDTQEAAKLIRRYARPDALIISFQNGVGNKDVLQGILGQNIQGQNAQGQKILGGVVPFNVTGRGPGQFHSGTDGALSVEHCDDPRLEILQKAFRASGQDIHLVNDILAVQWGKLLVNLNNGLNCLTGGPLRAGLMQYEYRKALALIIQEALDILRAAQ